MTEAHDEAYFRASHQGAEIDPIFRKNSRMFGLECKRAIRHVSLLPFVLLLMIWDWSG